MTAYSVTLTLHVLIAVLGLGQLSAVTLIAAKQKASPELAKGALATIGTLTARVSGSLVGLLLTGLALDWFVGGGFHRMWWFRIAFLLVAFVGVGAGRIRQLVRRASNDAASTLDQVRFTTNVLAGLVAVIVVLMVSTPS